MKNPIKFAIIGCGRIAGRHAEYIDEFASLQAVSDIKEEKSVKLAEKYGAKAYQDIHKMLESEREVEVVAICSPNGLHAEHTIAALKAGKHVICEKPMATSVHDARQMIRTAEKCNKSLFVIKQNRFNPPIAQLKTAMDAGKLGKIFNIQINCFWNRNEDYYLQSDWKGSKELDGGTLFTQFSHFLDLALWIMEDDVKEVCAYGNNYMHQDLIDFEDTGVIILKFFNEAIGSVNYTVNAYDHNMEGSITVFGEKGTVKVGGQYLNALEYQSIKDYKIEVKELSGPANDYGFYKGSMSNHDKVYKNVVEVLTKNGTIATTGMEGLKTVALIEEVYRNLKLRLP